MTYFAFLFLILAHIFLILTWVLDSIYEGMRFKEEVIKNCEHGCVVMNLICIVAYFFLLFF